MPLHDGHRQRLRQTYMEGGASTMREHQLLELLLTFAIPRRDVNPIAHALIERYGSIEDVLRADIKELMKTEGIGESAAVLMSLAGTLRAMPQRRRQRLERLNTPERAADYCARLLHSARYETTFAVSLDGAKRALHADMVSSGTLSENVVYPRLIAECALRHGADSVILCHNHPSGDPRPSMEDISVTKAVFTALSGIGIALHDHIIIGGDEAYSMVRGAHIPPKE